LVNGVGECVGCHTFPRFLRPVGTAPTPANSTANLQGLGSDPRYGNPFLDPVPLPSGPDQSVTGQMKANINADTHGIVTHTQTGVPIYPNNHFLAGGRCFGKIGTPVCVWVTIPAFRSIRTTISSPAAAASGNGCSDRSE